ncbi:hypothetical protein [Streptomyces collinus]|uniref:hypothetical protein n=1 Tax=Streptomyces collinus TaxID=42684 RepID=UPI0036AE0C60
MESRSTALLFTPVLRMLTGLLGAMSFGTGVLAVFVTQNGTGTGVLLAFGGVLVVLALLGNRIESFEFGGTKLKLRAAAAERFAMAEESERSGDDATAGQLRAEAQALLAAAGPVAADYQAVRSSMRPGPERTRAMEEIMSRARRLPAERQLDAAEVLRWLRAGDDKDRVTALGIMQASRELRNFEAALAAVEDPRSAFEQYHAMLLTALMIDDLDATQQRRLAEVVEAQRGSSSRFRDDIDRWRLSEDILARLQRRPGSR